MKSKIIIVPKDQQAENDLDYDIAKFSSLIIWNLSASEYKELNKAGIFDLFNKYCGCLIDDYEDEHIDYLQLIALNDDIFANNDTINVNIVW